MEGLCGEQGSTCEVAEWNRAKNGHQITGFAEFEGVLSEQMPFPALSSIPELVFVESFVGRFCFVVLVDVTIDYFHRIYLTLVWEPVVKALSGLTVELSRYQLEKHGVVVEKLDMFQKLYLIGKTVT